MMESMTSIAPSAGSTTAMGLEDDANNFSMAQTGLEIHEDCFETPKRTNSLPACGSTYEPECDDTIQPSIGMRFDSWEAGLAFYRMYAHEVGFSVRIWTQHKGEGGVIIWKKFVCARQGWRKEKSVEVGQDTQGMQRKKVKRNIKISRCGKTRLEEGKSVEVGQDTQGMQRKKVKRNTKGSSKRWKRGSEEAMNKTKKKK